MLPCSCIHPQETPLLNSFLLFVVGVSVSLHWLLKYRKAFLWNVPYLFKLPICYPTPVHFLCFFFISVDHWPIGGSGIIPCVTLNSWNNVSLKEKKNQFPPFLISPSVFIYIMEPEVMGYAIIKPIKFYFSQLWESQWQKELWIFIVVL